MFIYFIEWIRNAPAILDEKNRMDLSRRCDPAAEQNISIGVSR